MKIIKIGALWCPACLITNKALDKFTSESEDIEIVNLDYDYDEEEVKKYNIGKTLPVLIFEKDGIEITRLVGEKSYNDIKEAVGDIK